MILVAIGIWLVCGIVGYLIGMSVLCAKSPNRSWFEGDLFFLSLLGGPINLLATMFFAVLEL